MSHCCPFAQSNTPVRQRGDGLFATLFKLILLYVVLVFGAGTLMHTGHPVAVEAGKLVRVVSMIDPAIHWAESQHWMSVANGLRVLAHGAPLGAIL